MGRLRGASRRTRSPGRRTASPGRALAVGTCVLALAACTISGASGSATLPGGNATAVAGGEQAQRRVDWLAAQATPLELANLSAPTGDLAPIADRLKSARLVGLGEATHGTEEFHDLRFRLLRRLVETGRTRFIVLEEEAGGVEPLNRYLTRGEGDLHAAMMQLLIYYQMQPYEELFTWLRRWNAAHPRDQVQLWGADAQQPSTELAALADGYPQFRTEAARIRPAIDRLGSLEGRDFPRAAAASAAAVAAEYARRGWDEATLKKLAASARREAESRLTAMQARARNADPRARLLVRALALSLSLTDPVLTYHVRTEQWAKVNAALTSGGAGLSQRDEILAELTLAAVAAYPSSASGVYLAHNGHVSRGYIAAGGPASGRLLGKTLGAGYQAVLTDFASGSFSAAGQGDDESAGNGLTAFTVEGIPRASLSGKLARTGLPAAWLWLSDLDRRNPEHVWLFDPLSTYTIGGTFSTDDTIVRVLGDRRVQVLPEIADAVLFVRTTTATELSPAMDKAINAARKKDAARRGDADR